MSNKRSRAHRSNDRNTRYATHVPVLQECITALAPTATDPICVVEHGMGLGSTPFFHSVQHVKEIVSFEREPEWLWCANCISGSKQPHSIVLLKDDHAIEQAQQHIDMPERTLGLVDGFASQRLPVLEAWMKLGMSFIVEHDAETFGGRALEARNILADRYGYDAYQYSGHDPETAFFIVKGLQLTLTGSCTRL